jgi:cyclic pyranopterin phosphate synthase
MAKLSHFDQAGKSRIVDISVKEPTLRKAVASGLVRMSVETLTLVRDRGLSKGDVLEIARIAAIMAAKKTSEIIPLCHPVQLTSIEIDFKFPDTNSIEISATAIGVDRTGLEMEAMTAVAVAGLTIYDMCKSVDREMIVSQIQLEQKSGGKSGDFLRTPKDLHE